MRSDEVFARHSAVGKALADRVAKAVRALCKSRRTGHGRRYLTAAETDRLVEKMIDAACYAAIGSVPNKVPGRGPGPDNARIILLDDIVLACKELKLPAAIWRNKSRSLVIDLYVVVAEHVWGAPIATRNTIDRRKRARIARN